MNSKILLLLLLFSLVVLIAYSNTGGSCSEFKYLHVELRNAIIMGVFDMFIILSSLIFRLWIRSIGMHTLLSVAKLCIRILWIRVHPHCNAIIQVLNI